MTASGEGMYSFLCALLWPFVDSYYVAALILFSLQVRDVPPCEGGSCECGMCGER